MNSTCALHEHITQPDSQWSSRVCYQSNISWQSIRRGTWSSSARTQLTSRTQMGTEILLLAFCFWVCKFNCWIFSLQSPIMAKILLFSVITHKRIYYEHYFLHVFLQLTFVYLQMAFLSFNLVWSNKTGSFNTHVSGRPSLIMVTAC